MHSWEMQILSGMHLKAFNVITGYYIFYSQGDLISSAQKVWPLLTRQKMSTEMSAVGQASS